MILCMLNISLFSGFRIFNLHLLTTHCDISHKFKDPTSLTLNDFKSPSSVASFYESLFTKQITTCIEIFVKTSKIHCLIFNNLLRKRNKPAKAEAMVFGSTYQKWLESTYFWI